MSSSPSPPSPKAQPQPPSGNVSDAAADINESEDFVNEKINLTSVQRLRSSFLRDF
jgi:hypothetical protein